MKKMKIQSMIRKPFLAHPRWKTSAAPTSTMHSNKLKTNSIMRFTLITLKFWTQMKSLLRTFATSFHSKLRTITRPLVSALTVGTKARRTKLSHWMPKTTRANRSSRVRVISWRETCVCRWKWPPTSRLNWFVQKAMIYLTSHSPIRMVMVSVTMKSITSRWKLSSRGIHSQGQFPKGAKKRPTRWISRSGIWLILTTTCRERW